MRFGIVARRVGCLAVALVGFAPPVVAQRISIAPTIGVYIPTTELVKAVNGQDFKHQVSLTIGGRLGIWFGNRFGIEGTGTYVPSKLTFTDTGQSTEDANLFFGTGRVTLFLIPVTSPVWVSLNGGVGVVHRSGAAYANSTDRSDVGGAFGASVGIRLGHLLAFQVNADDYIYNASTDIPGITPTDPSRRQNDVQLSFGLGFPLGAH